MHLLRKRWLHRSLIRTAVFSATGAFIIWSMVWSEFNLQTLFQSGPRFGEFFTRLVPPDWSVTHLVVKSTLETLMITLAGTAIAVFLSLPLGFLAASNVTPPWIAQPVRLLLGFIRSIPPYYRGPHFRCRGWPGSISRGFGDRFSLHRNAGQILR